MRRLKVYMLLLLLLALGGSPLLTACGGQPTTVACFGPRPVSSVHPLGRSISFSVTTVKGTFTYSVPQSAFGGSPAAMRNGDLIAFCAEQAASGGHATTTITKFSDQGQPTATSTLQPR